MSPEAVTVLVQARPLGILGTRRLLFELLLRSAFWHDDADHDFYGITRAHGDEIGVANDAKVDGAEADGAEAAEVGSAKADDRAEVDGTDATCATEVGSAESRAGVDVLGIVANGRLSNALLEACSPLTEEQVWQVKVALAKRAEDLQRDYDEEEYLYQEWHCYHDHEDEQAYQYERGHCSDREEAEFDREDGGQYFYQDSRWYVNKDDYTYATRYRDDHWNCDSDPTYYHQYGHD
jgi:hypothetical protein